MVSKFNEIEGSNKKTLPMFLISNNYNNNFVDHRI